MGGGSDIDQTRALAAHKVAADAPDMPGDGPSRPRLDWVDALKGVGIVAVVAGHVWTRGPVRDALYAFHMPLFFILSGYTARYVPWAQFLPRLSRSLLVPFVSFSILLIGADFLIEGMRGVRPIFGSWLAGATTILFETERLRGPFTILWFIPCLFLARLFWNALARNALAKSGRNPDDGRVLLGIALVFALALVAQYHGTRSPFALLAVPGALLMIWTGALWRSGRPAPPLAVLAFAALAAVTLLWLPPLNMKLGGLGWPVLSLVGAVAVTVTLARILQHMPMAMTRPLAALGRASLVIMYVHVAFIHYLAPYGPKTALFVAALGGALGMDRLIRTWRPARIALLGEGRAPR